MSAGKSLPPGWIVKQSTSRPDRVYYFNVNTNESIWEFPSNDCPNKSTNLTPNPVRSAPNPLRLPDTTKEKLDYDFFKEKQKMLEMEKKLLARLSRKLSNPDLNSPVQEREKIFSLNKEKSPTIPTAVVSPVTTEKSTDAVNEVLCRRCSATDNIPKNVHLKCDGAKILTTSPDFSSKQIVKNSAVNSSIESSTSRISCSSLSFDEISSGELSSSSPDCEQESSTLLRTSLNESLTGDTLDEVVKSYFKSYYFVVDTNVLISDAGVVKKILNTSLHNRDASHIFIPYVVIQELDNVTGRVSKSSNVHRGAKDSVRYLNRMIKSKHPRFHIQSPQEKKDWAKAYSRCNDDHILECCVSLADTISKENVILLTNDINLTTKALVFDITVHTLQSLRKFLDTNVSVCKKGQKRKTIKQAKSSIKQSKRKKVLKQIKKKPNSTSIMSEAMLLLQKVLEPFLTTEMSQVFGEEWKNLEIDTSNLSEVLLAISKFWDPVFSSNFTEKDRRNFELLQTKSDHTKGLICGKEECLVTLSAIEDVFCHIKRRHRDQNVPIESIQDMRAACVQCSECKEGKKVKTSPNCGDLSSNDVVYSVFQQNWEVANHLCGMISDFYNISHSFPYEKPETFPSEVEFDRLICCLYPGIEQIKKLMSSVVQRNSKGETAGIKFYKKFAGVLKNFIPSLQIEADLVDIKKFSPSALSSFCQSPANHQKIEEGYKQLEAFFVKLEEALHAMSSGKNCS